MTGELVQLGGVAFRPARPGDVTTAISSRLRRRSEGSLVVGYVNPHVITLAAEYSAVAEHLRRCDLVLVDGIGVSLALRLGGSRPMRRAAHHMFDQMVDDGTLRGRVAVVGVEPEAIGEAASAIEARSAGEISMVGVVDGFADDDTVGAMVEASSPDVLLIGAGSPRSEALATMVLERFDVPVVLMVGAGTLKTYAGVRRDAPPIVHRLGLSWLFRYFTEPHTRDRYRRGLPTYVRLLARHNGGRR